MMAPSMDEESSIFASGKYHSVAYMHVVSNGYVSSQYGVWTDNRLFTYGHALVESNRIFDFKLTSTPALLQVDS